MNSSRPFIFVVEDSKDLRDLIKILFDGEGYATEFACDGLEALQKLRSLQQMPSLILLDLMMPGMDGFQFRAEQQKDPRLSKIPVLIMTADANAKRKAKQLGTTGYLRKPVEVNVLIKVAEKYCA